MDLYITKKSDLTFWDRIGQTVVKAEGRPVYVSAGSQTAVSGPEYHQLEKRLL